MINLTPKAKTYLKVMAIAVAIDLGGYILAHYGHLPAWIDANGTAYAAMILEPAAGLLVAFVVSFFKAAAVYTSADLMSYVLGASVALIYGVGMRKNGRICLKRLPAMSCLFVVTNTILGVGINFWRGGIISGWEKYFSGLALSSGVPDLLAVTFGVFVLKVADAVIMAVVLLAAWKLTPKSWINEVSNSPVSFSNPYFTAKPAKTEKLDNQE